mmetsp:Transcript_73177/g.136757  ORF Transcript_73177/g.136757 Transcript_73177/m.136757 type:complete len:270 (+) Transcript_73177:105-914(+)
MVERSPGSPLREGRQASHIVWGEVDTRPGAASDESSSTSNPSDPAKVLTPPRRSLAEPLDEKLKAAEVNSLSASSASSSPSPGSDTTGAQGAQQATIADAQTPKGSECISATDLHGHQLQEVDEGKDESDEFDDEMLLGLDHDLAAAAAAIVVQGEQGRDSSVGLASRAPCWSVGSALHDIGQCNPCAWYWKPNSCTGGTACTFCHMCGPGVFQQRTLVRRAERVAELRAMHRKPRGRGRRNRPRPPGRVESQQQDGAPSSSSSMQPTT